MSPAEILLKKLQSVGDVSEADRAQLRALPIVSRRYDANANIVLQGSEPQRSVLVLNGVLARQQELVTGMRQTVSFHFKGEIPDLHTLHIRRMDHSLTAVTEVVVGFIAHEDLRRAVRGSDNLAELLWRVTLIDAAIFRQWIINNGCRGAVAGMAHLLCEFIVRARAIGDLAPDGSWPMPFTQRHIGEALGMSLVHVNRTLKAIREANGATIERGRLKVLDWVTLVQMAGFDPMYLHLQNETQDEA